MPVEDSAEGVTPARHGKSPLSRIIQICVHIG
ncbi:MAG: hypothetical protein JWO18_1281 [Microbacteriaceae bacterium]|nr:hypothetical protein [Microbacteriaceae bacterium]